MADPNSSPGATPEGGAMPPEEGNNGPTQPTEDLGDAGKRALADLRRELRSVQKERDDLATAKREREDGERTELEKAVRDRESVAGERDTLRDKVMKMEAAIDAGIPDQWRRLIGSTTEELVADAKSYAEQIGVNQEPERPDLGSGPRGGGSATGAAAFNEAIRRRARR